MACDAQLQQQFLAQVFGIPGAARWWAQIQGHIGQQLLQCLGFRRGDAIEFGCIKRSSTFRMLWMRAAGLLTGDTSSHTHPRRRGLPCCSRLNNRPEKIFSYGDRRFLAFGLLGGAFI